MSKRWMVIVACGFALSILAPAALRLLADEKAAPPSIRLLFLGDAGHHQPAKRFAQLQPVLAKRGIDLTYTDKVEDLNPSTLSKYDALVIYANTTKISPEQERSLLDYVESGKGFIPLHCASYCFLNSPKYIELVGAQFKRHGAGVVRTVIAAPDHPVMAGFDGFESWDETYTHDKHNPKDRAVLEYRVEGKEQEPWTWTRTQGKGRVFYTAWGHDARTWGNPGFQNLLERGIRWAVGGDPALAGAFAPASTFENPKMSAMAPGARPFEYVEAKVAYYPPGGARKGDGEWNKMQSPLAPDESMKHLISPVGFHIELFASEPQITKPICGAWDERGRLWIAETLDYPNDKQPEGDGRDRIKICEDTDGDGRADKFTVFAEKLSIPTSLTFSRGGVIVHQAPQTLFLKDTDGDDKADERRELFSGWSANDTHAGPSNLQYGLDNWIWGMQGYAGFKGAVGGESLAFNKGFYRFKPDGSKLEFVRSTNNNTWGLGFSEEGLVFGSTANANPSVYMPIANRYYEQVRGWSAAQLGGIAGSPQFNAVTDKVRQVDVHGGYTAAAGHALYTARAYPRPYWNRAAFVAEPTGHLVGAFVLAAEGADFKSHNPFNLFAGDDEWVAPIAAEVGPDGNVWVIDWYNYIVQHNPTPTGFTNGKGNAYETDLRDKRHGRIYRVVYGNTPASKTPNLKDASPEMLVETLRHPNMLWRKHAQRLLVERGKTDVAPQLIELVRDGSMDAIGLNVGAIHALWTLHGLGELDGKHAPSSEAAIGALQHKSAGVRRNAVAVLPRNADATQAILAAKLLDDSDAQVRLATLLALAEMPASAAAGEAIALSAAQPQNADDRWLPDAFTSAAAAHDVPFLKAAAAATVAGARHPRVLATVAIVAEHYARGKAADTVGLLLSELSAADPTVLESIVAGLARGWPKKSPARLDAAQEQAVAALFQKLPPGGKGQLINLAAKLGTKGLEKFVTANVASLLGTVSDAQKSDAERIAAAQQLIQFRAADADAANKVLELISPRTSPELAGGLIEALSASESKGVGPAIVERLAGLTPQSRAAAIRVLLGRSEWTQALLAAFDNGQVQLAELSLDQKQALAAHPDKKLAAAAKKVLGKSDVLPNADRQKVLADLLPLTKQKGDAALGKQVFTKQCAKCHMHGGEGNKIGPDLTGMAVHPKAELLTHLIDPSRSVEGNFRTYTVVTEDGRVLNGLLSSETKTSIELLDAENKRHAIQRADIEQLVASTKSLMPEGFEKQVKSEEIVDLLEFLTAKGKYFPLPLNKAATVVSTKSMFHPGDNGPDRLIFDDWGPKTFEGVPFQLIDPRGASMPNAILLYGPGGTLPPSMPKSVTLPCNSAAKAVHFLSGVSGWGYPGGGDGVSMIVRLHYEDGQTEDHELKNGRHFADYIRVVDVPGSKLAFKLRGQQLRYLSIAPKRDALIREIELVKGPDKSAPIVMAVTVETR